MNGIEKITERINEDAKKEITELEAKTQSDINSIVAKYAASAQEEYDKIIEQGKIAAKQRLERSASMTALEVRKRHLALKQEMVSAAFDTALEKLTKLPENKYVALLAKLAADASTTGKEKVILSPSDRAAYGKKVCTAANKILTDAGRPSGLTLSEESKPLKGGLILSNGNIDINCSFETILELRRDELSNAVAGIMFE